jgi:hypothetical protein
MEQAAQAPTGGGAVEGRHRVADIGLVLQQPRRGRTEALGAVGEGDDREPGPGHMVLPELAHLIVERDLRGRREPGRSGVIMTGGV